MNLYKITNTLAPNWSVEKKFLNQTDADNYAANLGATYSALEIQQNVPALEGELLLSSNMNFGQSIIDLFLLDNQAFGPFTPAQTDAMLIKFDIVRSYCALGSIPQLADVLPTIATDAVFTQERKDKYIGLVNDYLESIN